VDGRAGALHRQSTSWPVDRATFARLVLCILNDAEWIGITHDVLDQDRRCVFVHCLTTGTWSALLSDADITGDRWTHAVVAATHRARRDQAATRYYSLSAPGDVSMAMVRIACLNYEDGGLRNGAYDFDPFAAAFAPLAPNAPDVIAICEGKQWGHHGGTGIHEACATLDRVFDTPYVGEPGWHWRGTYGPAIIWNPTTIRMQRWTGADHESNPVHDRNIARMRLRREPDKRLNVLLRHYSFDSATERITEAERDTGYARDDIPTLLAGDLNATASGPLVPHRDWSRVPPWKLPHKSHRDEQGRPVSDTRALDILIGRYVGQTGEGGRLVARMNGAGFTAVPELAYATGTPADEAFRGTDNPRDGTTISMLIDWMLANRPLADRFSPGSYQVFPPPKDHPYGWWTNHRVQTAQFEL
jgi:hypothetical protein